jgi:RimJ/RimL family protein N-acetyltransferase
MFFRDEPRQILDRGDYLVVRSPENPTYFWGNFLLFPQPPQPGDRPRWEALFQQEIAQPPFTKHVAFGWDDSQGRRGAVEDFLQSGYDLEQSVVMTAEEVARPLHVQDQLEVRPLETDAAWDAVVALQILCRPPEHAEAAHTVFVQRRTATYRRLAESGKGRWFGAYLDDRLVGDLGLYVEQGLARFQAVETHPGFQGQGVARTLVHAASRFALQSMGARRLVIVAEADSSASRLYAAVGFQATEAQVGICRWQR